MIKPRLVLCSGAKSSATNRRKGRLTLKLDSVGSKSNVNIRFENLSKTFQKQLLPRHVDLLEIAAYVFTADCAVQRGKHWTGEDVEPWDRRFHFVIPVRDLAFWKEPAVRQRLVEALQYLADDEFTFEFVPLKQDRETQTYLDFKSEERVGGGSAKVLLFSGGLDSLAGAVESGRNGENLILVSHRSTATVSSRQKTLFEQLRNKFPGQITHIPVWVNKEETFNRESTQRTRSFLYAALGFVIASLVGKKEVFFYENGVVSLNLPVADEVLRSRASRTTHPKSLALLSSFLALVGGNQFLVTNPYFHKTKKDVVSGIVALQCGDLIAYSCSCSHLMFKPRQRWHCGRCSQCIDRRFAVIGANAESFDSEDDYERDVFTGERSEGYDKNIAVGFTRHGLELSNMHEATFFQRFSVEISRAVNADKQIDAMQIFEAHRNHGINVKKVLQGQFVLRAPELVEGVLPATCLLRMVAASEHSKPSWTVYSTRIVEVIQAGLPTLCKDTKPANEPALQLQMDGLLKAAEMKLVREFPLFRWGWVTTKPDYSNDSCDLLVEVKYFRTRADRLPISEAVAADITKYGTTGRNVLFIFYDPFRVITDDDEVLEPFSKTPNMVARFIR